MQLDTNATYLYSVSADAGQYLFGYLQCIHPKAGNPRDQKLQCFFTEPRSNQRQPLSATHSLTHRLLFSGFHLVSG